MMDKRRLVSRLRAWLPLLPLVLLLLASYWLSLQVQPLPQTRSEQRHDPDFIIDHLSSTTLNEHGQPRFILATERMWHYPDDDTTHLQIPQLSSYSAGAPPSQTSAQTGVLGNRNEDLYLYDDVQMVRPAADGFRERRFHTDYLHVSTEQGQAETDRPVWMSDGRNTLSAVGLELDNEKRTIKLLSKVRASHEPLRK